MFQPSWTLLSPPHITLHFASQSQLCVSVSSESPLTFIMIFIVILFGKSLKNDTKIAHHFEICEFDVEISFHCPLHLQKGLMHVSCTLPDISLGPRIFCNFHPGLQSPPLSGWVLTFTAEHAEQNSRLLVAPSRDWDPFIKGAARGFPQNKANYQVSLGNCAT